MNNLDYGKRVIVKNTTDIDAYFVSVLPNGIRYDAMVPGNGETTLTVEEVLTQVRVKNALFLGYSAEKKGYHAHLYIEDEAVRREAGFDTDTYKQEIFDIDAVIALFEIPRVAELKRALPYKIVSIGDRYLLQQALDEGRITNYERAQIALEFLKGNSRIGGKEHV